MIILIEGQDGVGKTTLANELSKRINFMNYGKGINALFNQENETEKIKLVDQINDIINQNNLIINSLLTGAGDLYALMYKKNVILDRGFLSNYVWNYNEETFPIFQAFLPFVEHADMVAIILVASSKTRIQRIKGRNRFDIDLLDCSVYEDLTYKFIEAAQFYSIKHHLFYTDNKTVNILVDEICSWLKNRYNLNV